MIAGTGVQALQLIEEQGFDLVLMDVQMPEMDGFEATAALGEYDDICRAAGMDDYVSKPIKTELLIQVIDRVLELSRLRDCAIASN